jgi:hypothetical protein
MYLKEGSTKEFEQAPAGNHVARSIGMIDLGTQTGEWQGKPTVRRQIVIRWELPTETMHDGKPFIVSKFYTASLGERATLRAHLTAWRGREFTSQELMSFHAKNILGKPCLLNVIHSDSGKARVEGIGALPKGMEVPPQINPTVYFSLEREEFDTKIFETLPDFYKELIKKSPEYTNLSGPASPVGKGGGSFDDMVDDIPF